MASTGRGVRVRASAATEAKLGDLENKHFLLGAIGARKAFDGSLEVDKIVFTFNTSAAGKIFWDPTVGINEPPAPTAEPTAAPTVAPTKATATDATNETLVSGASSMSCIVITGMTLLLLSVD